MFLSLFVSKDEKIFYQAFKHRASIIAQLIHSIFFRFLLLLKLLLFLKNFFVHTKVLNMKGDLLHVRESVCRTTKTFNLNI